MIPLLTGIDRDHGLRCGPTRYLAAVRAALGVGEESSLGGELVPAPSRVRRFVAGIHSTGRPVSAPVPVDLCGDPGELAARLLRYRRDEWSASFLGRTG
ncbi:hypothetical protein ACWED2_12165 [Amycolatopsis sp. NPDC005003]